MSGYQTRMDAQGNPIRRPDWAGGHGDWEYGQGHPKFGQAFNTDDAPVQQQLSQSMGPSMMRNRMQTARGVGGLRGQFQQQQQMQQRQGPPPGLYNPQLAAQQRAQSFPMGDDTVAPSPADAARMQQMRPRGRQSFQQMRESQQMQQMQPRSQPSSLMQQQQLQMQPQQMQRMQQMMQQRGGGYAQPTSPPPPFFANAPRPQQPQQMQEMRQAMAPPQQRLSVGYSPASGPQQMGRINDAIDGSASVSLVQPAQPSWTDSLKKATAPPSAPGQAGGAGGAPTSWKMSIEPMADGGMIQGYQDGGRVLLPYQMNTGGSIPMVYSNGGWVPAYGLGGFLAKVAPFALGAINPALGAGVGALISGIKNKSLKSALMGGVKGYLGGKALSKGLKGASDSDSLLGGLGSLAKGQGLGEFSDKALEYLSEDKKRSLLYPMMGALEMEQEMDNPDSQSRMPSALGAESQVIMPQSGMPTRTPGYVPPSRGAQGYAGIPSGIPGSADGGLMSLPGYGLGGFLKKYAKVAAFGPTQLLPQKIRDPLNKIALKAAPIAANFIPGGGPLVAAGVGAVAKGIEDKIDSDRARDAADAVPQDLQEPSAYTEDFEMPFIAQDQVAMPQSAGSGMAQRFAQVPGLEDGGYNSIYERMNRKRTEEDPELYSGYLDPGVGQQGGRTTDPYDDKGNIRDWRSLGDEQFEDSVSDAFGGGENRNAIPGQRRASAYNPSMVVPPLPQDPNAAIPQEQMPQPVMPQSGTSGVGPPEPIADAHPDYRAGLMAETAYATGDGSMTGADPFNMPTASETSEFDPAYARLMNSLTAPAPTQRAEGGSIDPSMVGMGIEEMPPEIEQVAIMALRGEMPPAEAAQLLDEIRKLFPAQIDELTNKIRVMAASEGGSDSLVTEGFLPPYPDNGLQGNGEVDDMLAVGPMPPSNLQAGGSTADFEQAFQQRLAGGGPLPVKALLAGGEYIVNAGDVEANKKELINAAIGIDPNASPGAETWDDFVGNIN